MIQVESWDKLMEPMEGGHLMVAEDAFRAVRVEALLSELMVTI